MLTELVNDIPFYKTEKKLQQTEYMLCHSNETLRVLNTNLCRHNFANLVSTQKYLSRAWTFPQGNTRGDLSARPFDVKSTHKTAT